MELADRLEETFHRKEILATGKAGTVYLCHPHLAHAAQPNRGQAPRFMAQPPLLSKTEFLLHRTDSDRSPVELAIRKNGFFLTKFIGTILTHGRFLKTFKMHEIILSNFNFSDHQFYSIRHWKHIH